jgi:hypothetical protein
MWVSSHPSIIRETGTMILVRTRPIVSRLPFARPVQSLPIARNGWSARRKGNKRNAELVLGGGWRVEVGERERDEDERGDDETDETIPVW